MFIIKVKKGQISRTLIKRMLSRNFILIVYNLYLRNFLVVHDDDTVLHFNFQFILPAIVHINHQPYLERGDGPIVSMICNRFLTFNVSILGE